MFIIVEGPDGAGKTTFVRELALELWRQERGTVLINPKRSPVQPVLLEYIGGLEFYRPGAGRDLILDRCWYSDDVYGPIWRGFGLTFGERSALEEWAHKMGAVIAYLDVDDETLVERVLGERLESDDPSDVEHMTEGLVKEYAAAYRKQHTGWALPTFINPSPTRIIEHARFHDERAKGRKS